MQTPQAWLNERRLRWLAAGLAICLASIACGDERHQSEPKRSRMAPSAEAERKEVLTDLFDEYDRLVDINCPCFVETGAYPSIDECTMWQASGEDWVSCTSEELRKDASGEALEAYRCIREQLAVSARCLATKSCDPEERTECDLDPLACITGDSVREVALAVGAACPDTALLPRQH